MQRTVEPHSKIGVVSGAMGIGMFLIFLIGISAYYFQIRQGRGPNSEVLADLQLMIVWLLPVPVHIIGLILGVVSLFFPNRKKLFPILGVVGNLIFSLIGVFPWLWLVIGGMGKV